jgi:hypothetical protein
MSVILLLMSHMLLRHRNGNPRGKTLNLSQTYSRIGWAGVSRDPSVQFKMWLSAEQKSSTLMIFLFWKYIFPSKILWRSIPRGIHTSRVVVDPQGWKLGLLITLRIGPELSPKEKARNMLSTPLSRSDGQAKV